MTTCFVIGPIGNELAPLDSPERLAWESSLEIYERVIRAACDFLDIEAIRADQISIAGDINDQIFRHLYEADLVIADLTGANANVMYELGLRHSLNRLTIQVADRSTPLPFDVKAVRTILIERSPLGLVDARKRLVKAIETGLSGKTDMVAATRVWESLRTEQKGDLSVVLGQPSDEESQEVEDANEAGYIELLLGLEESFGAVTRSLQAVGESMVAMNEDTSRSSARLAALPPSASAAARLGEIRNFADDLKGHATKLEDATDSYRADLDALDAQVTPLLRIMSANPALRDADGSGKFLDTISSLASSARQAFEGFGGFTSSVDSLGTLSSMLKAPSRSIARSISRLAETVTMIDDWDAAARRLRDVRTNDSSVNGAQ